MLDKSVQIQKLTGHRRLFLNGGSELARYTTVMFIEKMNSAYIRLNELVSLHPAEDERSRFFNFWEDFCEIPERVKTFTLIENELSELDNKSWNSLKGDVKELCVKSDEKRGWSQLFEKLNEAKGYCFPKSIKCSDVRFIPRSKKNNIETPDLEGCRNTFQVLCEVKTINISEELVSARINMSVMSVQNKLTSGLINKLESTFTKAASQLNTYSKSSSSDKYIYIVITYDDDLDYRNELNVQARELYNALNLVGVDLVIHNEA